MTNLPGAATAALRAATGRTVDPVACAAGLRKVDEGFWVSDAEPTGLSYAPDGHEWCYSVEERSYWFLHRNEIIASVVARYAPGETLYDVGGGTGFVSLALQRAGLESVLVEPGPLGVEHARARGLRFVVRSTFHDARFRPASVGAFGLFDVLEHIEHDAGLIGSLREGLRPGGLLFLTVPAFPALWSAEDQHVGHFRRYRLGALSRLALESGLDVVFASYFFWPLAPAVLLARAIPSRLALRRPSRAVSRHEHTLPSGWPGRLMARALAWEGRRIGTSKRMPFGSSCLLVARRPAMQDAGARWRREVE